MEKSIVTGISHLAFNVVDMDRSIDFYCNGLGLKKIFEIIIPENIAEIFPDNPISALAGKPGIAYLEIASGQFVELFYPKPYTDLNSGGPNYERIGYVHLSLVVGDIYEAANKLKERGITLDSEITLGPDHTYQFWIKDPDGNRIELMQYTEKSFQVVYGGHST
jgi:catechol 2,3-dioxygenase-like lactoylglutathione lyase family enzyme